MKKTILFGVACFAVLLAGCLPQEKLTGRVIDTTGPVSGAAVLGMVWVEDTANIKAALEVKDLSLEERDTALNADMKTRGLPTAYARGFADKDGWFNLEKLHFSAETTQAIKAMKEPRITRVTVWAFQRGYRKQAVTTFLKDTAQEIPAATLLLFKPADWKELYRDNTVDSLTRDYMVKGYSKEFGATEAEKDWILEYTHSNLWQAYVESDIKGDKEMEEMCGRDYSDLVVSDEGIYRNPDRERCAELKQRMGAVRDIEELWIVHAKRSEDPLAAAKEVVRRAIALLPAEASEPVQYESMILSGIEDAANAESKGAVNGNPSNDWQKEAKLHYGRGDKAAAYRVLGSSIYHQLPEEIKQGALTAQLAIRTVPGIRETAAGFYLLMNRPLTAQLPGGDNGNNGGKAKTSTDTAKEEGIPIEEYVPKMIIEGKWGTGPGEFGVAWTYASDTDSPMSPSGSKSMPIYPSSLAVDGKGNIYVLDAINNRIQKFDVEGKFLKTMAVDAYMGEEQPIWYGKVKTEDGREMLDRVESKDKSGSAVGVDSWFPYYWPITVEGINIVIDSNDTLYYYLKRTKDGEETGEVWEFRKDKLVKKTSVPNMAGALDIRDGGLWISKYPFAYVRTDIGEDYSLSEKKTFPRKQLNAAQNQKMAKLADVKRVGRGISLLRRDTGNQHTLVPMWNEEFEGEAAIKDSSVYVLSRRGTEVISNKFNLSGRLLRRTLAKKQPRNGIRDSQDNVYQIESADTGVRVWQFHLAPTR